MATRKRYRNCGVGRHIIELLKTQSVCGAYDAFLPHADTDAVDFLSYCGLTYDALLNDKFREVRDEWTNTTLMSYLPPSTTVRELEPRVFLDAAGAGAGAGGGGGGGAGGGAGGGDGGGDGEDQSPGSLPAAGSVCDKAGQRGQDPLRTVGATEERSGQPNNELDKERERRHRVGLFHIGFLATIVCVCQCQALLTVVVIRLIHNAV
uniref:N-acetyltransferase domain-containing protein n=1 Tax=Hucho hucho TaxID=62062 RepID=A0A4W5MWR2_9TELE